MSTEIGYKRAHTPSKEGAPSHSWTIHSAGVAGLASEFGDPLGLSAECRVAGWCHDLGKLGYRFELRLQGKESGIDHSSAGAYFILHKFKNVPTALVIEGHHIGLQMGSKNSLRRLEWDKLCGQQNTRLSSDTLEELTGTEEWQNVILPSLAIRANVDDASREMTYARMLFSCLVDADFLDTEAHFSGTLREHKKYRPTGHKLDAQKCLVALDSYMALLGSKGTPAVNALRQRVKSDCEEAASDASGLFTLTAPTGTGKTLSMLRFAILHAQKNGLRRIVVVLPYLNLIDEAAKIYREVFKEFPADFVLEDHSIARSGRDIAEERDIRTTSQLWSENWDAPIVITTNVQFLESLHANRPSSCRKLHRLGMSVILMDEVQTIPASLAIATLSTLSNMSASFGSTIVFATATQPAFGSLNAQVEKLVSPGWKPTEIVREVPTLFKSSRRVTTHILADAISWVDLASKMDKSGGVLGIVNLKRDATELYYAVANRVGKDRVAHLSTNMIQAHRRWTLEKLKERNLEQEGWLVATQCIEAGVDLDFRTGYRAWAPMESLAQAAGRVNRNGQKETAEFTIFSPLNQKFPDPGYAQAAGVARRILESCPDICLNDPALFKSYYVDLYQLRGLDTEAWLHEPLVEAIRSQNFVEVAKLYSLIPEAGVNIFIPIGEFLGAELFEKNQELLVSIEKGINRRTLSNLMPFSVSTFLPEGHKLVLLPIKTFDGEEVPNWYRLKHPEEYDETVGLLTHQNQAEYIV